MYKAASPSLHGISIVFDLDGTLVNTAPDLQATLNHILEKDGLNPVSPEVSQGLIGQGAKAMLRAGLAHQGASRSDAAINSMFEAFLVHYAANIDAFSKPYPGCVDALERLSNAGACLSVCTNKTQRLADRLLSALNLTDYFAIIVGADSVPDRKPHGDHILKTLEGAKGSQSKAIMVGDSQTDERAAHNAGLPFLFVPFGYGPISSSVKNNRVTLDHFDHLTAAVVTNMLKR